MEDISGKQFIRIRPADIANPLSNIKMLEAGDGSVTKPSLLARNSLDSPQPGDSEGPFPLAYSMFLCKEHSQLTGNVSFQDNLLNVLLIQQNIEDRVESVH